MKFQWNKQYTDAVVIALVIIFPIVLAGVPIGDDYVRLYNGIDFNGSGRWFATWLFQVLSNDKFIFNLFPLPQILGIIIYAISLAWITQKLSITDRISNALIILFALSFPFIFQNYAYQYDCLTMMLALSIFSIAPFILIPQEKDKKQWVMYSLFKVLLLITGLLFYQPALVSFIIFSIFIYLANDDRKLKILFWHAAVLVAAYLIDHFMILTIGNTEYYRMLSHVTWGKLHINIVNHFIGIVYYIQPYYKNIFVIVSHIALLYFAVKYILLKHKDAFNIIFGVFLFISLILVTMVFVSIPDNIFFTPRLLMSLSSAYFCVALLAFKQQEQIKLLRTMLIIAIIPAIVVLCIYTKAASIQEKYDRMLITSLYDGLSKVEIKENQKIYFTCNQHWYAPYTQKVVERYPYMMGFIYTDYLRRYWFIREYLGDYNIDTTNISSVYAKNESDYNAMYQSNKLVSHYLYDIYEWQDNIYVCVK